MLSMLDSGAASAKRAYTSLMDLAIVPFIYSVWYDQTIFAEVNYFTYAYLVGTIMAFTAKEISQRYKDLNPHLEEKDYCKIVKAIDSVFCGISSASEIVFPAIILDVIYDIKEIFSDKTLKIVHPIFLSAAGCYGVYKGMDKYGFFASTESVSNEPNLERICINDSSVASYQL